MPLNPFHATCARPPERGDSVVSDGPCNDALAEALCRVGNAKLTHRVSCAEFETNRGLDCGGKCFAVFHPTNLFKNVQTTRSRVPFRRPSVGAAQGDARHGCRARSDGPGMALRDDPRSSAGGREVLRSKTRMQGWPSFWLLFLGHSRKSDSPSRAKPMLNSTRKMARPSNFEDAGPRERGSNGGHLVIAWASSVATGSTALTAANAN